MVPFNSDSFYMAPIVLLLKSMLHTFQGRSLDERPKTNHYFRMTIGLLRKTAPSPAPNTGATNHYDCFLDIQNIQTKIQPVKLLGKNLS